MSEQQKNKLAKRETAFIEKVSVQIGLANKLLNRMSKNLVKEYYTKALADLKNKNYDSAILLSTSAIALEPTNPAYFYLRGITRKEFQHYNNAIEDFTKAIEINPKDTVIYLYYFERAICKHHLSEFKSSIVDYDHAIKMFPQWALAYYNRGLAKSEIHDFKNACHDWLKAKELGYNGSDKMLNKYHNYI
ncbi:MAG TPA: hypothetical protein VI757_12480 [Bacteroidia bacterium]|nr:hypothetical protein [Bacteroidia bacterium]